MSGYYSLSPYNFLIQLRILLAINIFLNDIRIILIIREAYMNKIITISIIYTIIIGFSLFPSIKSDDVCQIKLDASIDLFLGEYISDSIQSNLSNVNYNYISRDTIMEIAKGFLNHEWYPTEDNIFHGTYYGNEVDTPDRDTYTYWPDTHGWKANQPAYGLPYQWLGYSSIDGYNLSAPKDFDEQYTGTGSFEGIIHFAGDINTADYTSRACGLDCSGFISRCWNLPWKHPTHAFSDIASPIRYYELQSGDILNIPYNHAILFEEFVNEEKTLIKTIESSAYVGKVNQHIYRVISINNDSFSVKLEGYPLTDNFGLYRYDFIDNAPETPSINGPSSGDINTEYLYEIVSKDPEGDNVSYCIDWGDNSEILWSNMHNSNITINISHSWNKCGTYTIRVKAKDIHNIESGWALLEVSMPKSNLLTRSIFHQILCGRIQNQNVKDLLMYYKFDFIKR